ncbi:neutral zinc metallopeptidase [Kribbella sandramycini]
MGPPMGPPPGPGFGFGGNGFPPKRKRSKAPFIIVPIVLVVAGVVSLYLFAMLQKQQRNNYANPTPVYTSTTNTPAPTWGPGSSTSTGPTVPKPTRPTVTRPSPTKTTPPPPSDTDLTARNKFYKTGVQRSVNCREPKSRPSTLPGARTYFADIVKCLNRAWPAQVRAAGFEWKPVSTSTYWGTGYSPCGSMVQRSFYCGSNRTIYMDAKSRVDWWQKYPRDPVATAWVRAASMNTTTHEYAHHLQEVTGILDAMYNIKYRRTGDHALEINRRMEIQATCFGQVFLGANRSTMVSSAVRKQIVWSHANSGDEYDTKRDHGSKAIQPYWSNRGYNSRNVGQCNTFTASPRLVR